MAEARARRYPSRQGVGLAERLLRQRLRRLEHGRIRLGAEAYGERTQRCGLEAEIRVHDPRFFAEVAWGGSVGAGEAYMLGYWDADDLVAALRILAVNREVMDGLEGGFARLSAPLRSALHWLARNTREGSRRNIAAHYDLGNAFFRLFLDPTMMYSSAVFERPGMTLEQAQVARLERICQGLALQPGDRVIEIGTGWGGFALHAASRYGCHVTTTTISAEQHALASKRVHEAGLSDLVTVLREDYRDLTGRFDKLVSIEMIEAIGHQYYDAFFAKCGTLLEDDGRMFLQAIVIADRHYEAARDSVDFIKRHIFPGCCIPSVSALTGAMARASDLRLARLDDIGPHYATTLRLWRENLRRNAGEVRVLGYPERFLRMWEFYLAYCEAGFAERALGDIHAYFEKPFTR
ncbi:MAG TPA: cyclopropane-fatty-acyl-phospholipid synthase family protein [Burkholderiales bacterium]|nr:cyclopropane-fatty-acyl-phospholipid synthase family protein [Burkholderiales bacterium]